LLELDPEMWSVHRYLGNALVVKGQLDAAMAEFRSALKVNPADAETQVALGMLLLNQDQFQEARGHFLEAVRVQPTNGLAHYQLALLHQHFNETREAIASYRAALAAQPDWPEVQNNLAWLLAAGSQAELRNGSEAVKLSQRACELTNYKEPLLVGTLAAANAEAGLFPDAIRLAEQARDLAANAGQKGLADRNDRLLELYRAGKPFHEPVSSKP
jgi:Tfp pilus assembly protein PilF